MAFPIETLQADFRIWSLAVSPDGARIGAAVEETIMIWDMHTRRTTLGPLLGHRNLISSIEFSPDGLSVASGSYDYTVRIWNAHIGYPVLPPLRGHAYRVSSVRFSHGGDFLISGSLDATIRLWDTRTGQSMNLPIEAGARVWSVAISPDDKKIVAALDDRTIRAYDAASGAVIFEGSGHTEWVYSVALSQSGHRIASASLDGTVRIWDGVTGHSIGRPLDGHTSDVMSVAFSPDGKYIASGSCDNTVRIWDAESGTLWGSPLCDHTGPIWAVVFTPDSTRLISACDVNHINIWDLHSLGTQLDNLRDHILEGAQVVEARITRTTVQCSAPNEMMCYINATYTTPRGPELNLLTCSDYSISSGGFGDVYRCKLKNGTQVAVKTIRLHNNSSEDNKKYLKHTARELYTWAQCRHPNVQQLLGLAVFRDQIGMISRWESNGSLTQYLGLHMEADRCVLSVHIARGLTYLHESGVIHGDLKGANVLVSRHGVPQLSDFGNSSRRESSIHFTSTSTEASISLRWTAPERFKGVTTSVATDIYALGMTILETITGDVPWVGKSDHAIIFALMIENACPERPETRIPKGSDDGETLWSLLTWCWEFDPEKRPSAAEVLEIMTRITRDGLQIRQT